eukprot:364387-Chlamydomonas_euryale.AAC.7
MGRAQDARPVIRVASIAVLISKSLPSSRSDCIVTVAVAPAAAAPISCSQSTRGEGLGRRASSLSPTAYVLATRHPRRPGAWHSALRGQRAVPVYAPGAAGGRSRRHAAGRHRAAPVRRGGQPWRCPGPRSPHPPASRSTPCCAAAFSGRRLTSGRRRPCPTPAGHSAGAWPPAP